MNSIFISIDGKAEEITSADLYKYLRDNKLHLNDDKQSTDRVMSETSSIGDGSAQEIRNAEGEYIGMVYVILRK